MELELKHLTPYLPFNLKFESRSPFEYDMLTMDGLRWVNGAIEVLDKEGSMWIYRIKPILRPLSDLRKYRNEIFKLQEINNDVALLFLNGYDYKELSVWEYEFLLENHFDVFGLIEKGLAIDINTLNKE